MEGTTKVSACAVPQPRSSPCNRRRISILTSVRRRTQYRTYIEFLIGTGTGDAKLPMFSVTRNNRNIEELPFFGPVDPPRWPLHKKLFLGGAVFPPLWIVGAVIEVRDTDDHCTWTINCSEYALSYEAGAELFRRRCQAAVLILVIVLAALIVLETAFKEA